MNYLLTLQKSINENRSRWFYIAFGSILFLASLLRLWNLASESAWIDEAYSIELAKLSIVDILKGSAADQHPPLYYLLLRLWLTLGTGITYARLLSVIIGVINVAQILLFGKKIAGIAIGLLSGILLAVSPMHVWYSQEIRMYILLVALTTASTTALWWALQDNKPYRWIFYGFFSTLSIYTHYFTFFILFAQGIWVLIWVWKQRAMRPLWYWIGASVGMLILFFPWLPVAINQARFHTMTWVDSPTIHVIRDTLLRLIFGVAILPWPDIFLWLITIVLIGLFIWSIREISSKLIENKQAYYFTAIIALVPFTAISISALIYPVYQFKQYLVVLPPMLMLAAWIPFSLPRKVGLAVISVLIISATVSLTYQQIYMTKDDWKGAAMFIDQNSRQGDIIYGNPAASELALAQYSKIAIPFIGVPLDYDIVTGGWEGEELTSKSVDSEFKQLSNEYQRLWLVEFFPEFWDSNWIIESWMADHSDLVDDVNFGRIRIRVYRFTE